MHVTEHGSVDNFFLISALGGGECLVSRADRFITGEGASRTTAWWAPEPVWTFHGTETSLAPAGNRTAIRGLVTC